MFFGCASKKKVDSSGDVLSSVITNEPLSLSPEGSDSQKISGLSTVHFDFDRAALLKNEIPILQQDAQWIKSHPGFKIQVEGHCDERGSTEYNLALGERRAKVVADSLAEMGVPRDRLTLISYGEERPLVHGSTEEAYAKNRRANFVPLKMEKLPAPPLAQTH